MLHTFLYLLVVLSIVQINLVRKTQITLQLRISLSDLV